MMLSILILVFVTAERLCELIYARRNTKQLLSYGAAEHAPGHYSLIVLLHATWLAGLWLLAWNKPVHSGWLALFALLFMARAWVILTLKERWTTRIIVLPDAPLVKAGPYGYLKHPNYAVVAGEIAVLPLAFGLPFYAFIFSLLNAVLLFIRIRAENAALAQRA